MRFIDSSAARSSALRSRAVRHGGAWAASTLAALLAVAGCTGSSDRAPGEVSKPVPPTAAAPKPPPLEMVQPSPQVAREGSKLPPPRPVRSMAELRQQAAERLVAANPDITYTGKVPDPLLSISVLEVELNADGSIRRIEVLRPPRFAKETLQTATDAVRRAAPYGDVSRLPRPWKFVETFLFDDQRRFKPRTLDN